MSPTTVDQLVVLQLHSHTETAYFHRRRVLLGRQQDAVRLYVTVHDVVVVAVPQSLQDLAHVVAAT